MCEQWIREDDRDRFHQEYDRWKWRQYRALQGIWRVAYYRVVRWFGLKRGYYVLFQLLYVASVVVAACATYYVSYAGFGEGLVSASSLAGVQSLCVAIVFVYKNFVSSETAKLTEHEEERRQFVGALIAELSRRKAIDHSQLDEQEVGGLARGLCEATRRDMEEFLQLHWSELRVILIGHQADTSRKQRRGPIWRIARDRDKQHDWFSEPRQRDGLESYAFEAIRCKRTIVYQDVQGRLFRKYFGRPSDRSKPEARCHCYIPVRDPKEAAPIGVLGIEFRKPYIIWPMKSRKVERRLQMYEKVATIFCAQGSRNDKAARTGAEDADTEATDAGAGAANP